jgi:hypothetical protein
MNKKTIFFLVCSWIMFGSLCFADESIEQNAADITTIGSHSGVTFYFRVAQNLSKDCQYSIVYCMNSNADCKSMLAIALTAKTMVKKVNFAYDYNSDKLCLLRKIEIP